MQVMGDGIAINRLGLRNRRPSELEIKTTVGNNSRSRSRSRSLSLSPQTSLSHTIHTHTFTLYPLVPITMRQIHIVSLNGQGLVAGDDDVVAGEHAGLHVAHLFGALAKRPVMKLLTKRLFHSIGIQNFRC